MGELFTPMHLIVLLVVFGIPGLILVAVIKGLKEFSAERRFEPTVSPPPPPAIDMPTHKFCSECGQQILRRAEICPLCGCRVA